MKKFIATTLYEYLKEQMVSNNSSEYTGFHPASEKEDSKPMYDVSNMFPNKNNEKIFIGYRNIKSSAKGKYGTFYNIQKPKHYQTNEVKLTFKNPLIIMDESVYNFEGLSLEYLFWKWFPDYDLVSNAKKQGIETGELIDKLITKEAIKRGYDGIIMADLEIVDLSTHDDYQLSK